MAEADNCAASPTTKPPKPPNPTPSPTKTPAPTPATILAPADIMLLDHGIPYREDASSFTAPQKASPEPSFSPSISAGSSESYTLSRCSSISSLASSYSAASTDDESSHKICLISILKKPRPSQQSRIQSQTKSQSHNRNRGHNHDHEHEHDHHGNNSDSDHDDDDDEDDEDEDIEADDEELEEWDDDDSECDVVFERNVTFEDPLATDIITGNPVLPSSRSRLEWTAVRARECLERERVVIEGAWSGFDEDETETGDDMASRRVGPEDATGGDQEEKNHTPKHFSESGFRDERRHSHKDSGREGEGEGEARKRDDAEVENSGLEVTQANVHLDGQQQQQKNQ